MFPLVQFSATTYSAHVLGNRKEWWQVPHQASLVTTTRLSSNQYNCGTTQTALLLGCMLQGKLLIT